MQLTIGAPHHFFVKVYQINLSLAKILTMHTYMLIIFLTSSVSHDVVAKPVSLEK